MTETESLQRRINDAIGLALGFGMIEGESHKMWVIDQVIRVLADDNYVSLIEDYSLGDNGPSTHQWDTGTPASGNI